MRLHTLWFIIIAVFWIGFFVLEGFDFGVGMLHTIVGRTETGTRVALNTIGPFWDGNEVWLIVAGAATFAAFPGWYATMFSALYLALLLLLVALMARGVAFEFRDKSDEPAAAPGLDVVHDARQPARSRCCSASALGDLLAGLPIDQAGRVHRQLLRPAPALRDLGRADARRAVACCTARPSWSSRRPTTSATARVAAARPLGWVAIALVLGFVIWTRILVGTQDLPTPVEALALIAVVFAARLARSPDHDGWAFTASAIAIASVIGSIFIDLYPERDGLEHELGLQPDRLRKLASGSYALTVMTVVAVIFLPVVLLYQGWSFHVFRARVKAPPEDGAT